MALLSRGQGSSSSIYYTFLWACLAQGKLFCACVQRVGLDSRNGSVVRLGVQLCKIMAGVQCWISTGFTYACSGSMHTIPVPLVAVTPFYKNSVPHANEQGAVTIVHCIPGTNYLPFYWHSTPHSSAHSTAILLLSKMHSKISSRIGSRMSRKTSS